jgi:hypothetical protein
MPLSIALSILDLTARGAAGDGAAEQALEPGCEVGGADGVPRRFGGPQRLEGFAIVVIACFGGNQPIGEVRHSLQERRDCEEAVIGRREVGADTAPRPVRRPSHELGADGIQGDIEKSRSEMSLVHGYGTEPLLE